MVILVHGQGRLPAIQLWPCFKTNRVAPERSNCRNYWQIPASAISFQILHSARCSKTTARVPTPIPVCQCPDNSAARLPLGHPWQATQLVPSQPRGPVAFRPAGIPKQPQSADLYHHRESPCGCTTRPERWHHGVETVIWVTACSGEAISMRRSAFQSVDTRHGQRGFC